MVIFASIYVPIYSSCDLEKVLPKLKTLTKKIAEPCKIDKIRRVRTKKTTIIVIFEWEQEKLLNQTEIEYFREN